VGHIFAIPAYHPAAAAFLLLAGADSLAAQQGGVRYAEVMTAAASADAIARTRAFAAELMDTAGLPGLSIAVGINGQVVYAEGFGWADIENRVPVTPLTRMRIGSVSKPVTAAALALLVDQGRLDLDQPVQRYVRSFPAKRWPITVRQVGGHIAGIRHYNGDENLNAVRFPTVDAGLDIFRNDTLLFEPSTRYSYSSYGWNLLSAVVEGASGQDFLTYMRSHVFQPLALTSIVAEHTDSLIDYRATFYERGRDGRLIRAPYVDNSYKWAGGGFISNSADLVRFAMAHATPGFIQSATIETLWRPQDLRNGPRTHHMRNAKERGAPARNSAELGESEMAAQTRCS
jgi:CubicO group peptidase (beta-lactamase class C family)